MIANNYITNWPEVVKHVTAEYPKEACGLVVGTTYVPCRNIAIDAENTFQIDPYDLIKTPRYRAVIHSHTNKLQDPRVPSKADLIGQNQTGVEWGIVVTDGENVTQPLWWGDPEHRPPLFDRDFIDTLQDCYSFAQDWYYQCAGLNLPWVPRDPDWYLHGEDHFSSMYAAQGFYEININEPLLTGDAILMSIYSPVINHVAISLGDGSMAHHLWKRTPCIEPVSKWKSRIEKIVRNPNASNSNVLWAASRKVW